MEVQVAAHLQSVIYNWYVSRICVSLCFITPFAASSTGAIVAVVIVLLVLITAAVIAAVIIGIIFWRRYTFVGAVD